MTTIVTRAGKGSRLTNAEGDANFNNLNNDKLEVSTAASTYQPLDADLTAIAALATNGYAKKTGVGTWAISATVAGSDITGAINSVTIGLTTPAAIRATTLLVNASAFLGSEVLRVIGDVNISGSVGLFGPIVAANIVSIGPGTHPSSATSLYGFALDYTTPATGTFYSFGYYSTLRTTATVFTSQGLFHFYAGSTIVGAGSTVTATYGFYADAGLATATNNYGFYSAINAAANTWGLYLNGTAGNYISSNLRLGTTSLVGSEKLRVAGIANIDTLIVNTLATINPSSLSTIDNTTIGTTTQSFARFSYASVGVAADNRYSFLANVPTSTGTTLQIYGAVATAPSTATSALWGYASDLRTAVAAFTLTNIYHYSAHNSTLGAGSTVTNVTGFRALDAIAVGTNNYGFASTINAATNNYGLYFSGTAKNYLNGELGVKVAASTSAALTVGTPSTTTSTAATCVSLGLTGSTFHTDSLYGVYSYIGTATAAYTVGEVVHFNAEFTVKGAGSTVTTSKGFHAGNNLVVGTNNYGFYSDINSATTTYQLYMGGTAPSYFAGNVVFNSARTLGWGGSPTTADTFLARQAANVLSMANSTTAQTFRVYGTTTGPKYLSLSHDGTNAIVDTSSASGRLSLGGNATSIFGLSSLLFTDNAFDIGATGATRPRSGFFATSVFSPIYGTTAAGNIAFMTNTSTQQFGIVHTASAARYVTVTGSVSGNPTFGTSAAAASIAFSAGFVKALSTVTYSASMTPDAALGNTFVITITNGVAHTINAPTNPSTGQEICFTLRNTSGGVAGAATWNAVFKMTAWAQPANGFSRSIYFIYNGTNWVETGRSAADVAN